MKAEIKERRRGGVSSEQKADGPSGRETSCTTEQGCLRHRAKMKKKAKKKKKKVFEDESLNDEADGYTMLSCVPGGRQGGWGEGEGGGGEEEEWDKKAKQHEEEEEADMYDQKRTRTGTRGRRRRHQA